jgi:ATP-dependent DNA ligase
VLRLAADEFILDGEVVALDRSARRYRSRSRCAASAAGST